MQKEIDKLKEEYESQFVDPNEEEAKELQEEYESQFIDENVKEEFEESLNEDK